MHQLIAVQKLPISIEKAWDFFSSPKNLTLITPKELNLIPTSELPEKMYPGMFITYSIKPFLGIPSKWVTEITHIREYKYFVDEQRVGLYDIWHHQHHFKEVSDGVQMTDIIDYKLPFGFLGKITHKLLIEKKIQTIFNYREKELKNIFGLI